MWLWWYYEYGFVINSWKTRSWPFTSFFFLSTFHTTLVLLDYLFIFSSVSSSKQCFLSGTCFVIFFLWDFYHKFLLVFVIVHRNLIWIISAQNKNNTSSCIAASSSGLYFLEKKKKKKKRSIVTSDSSGVTLLD